MFLIHHTFVDMKLELPQDVHALNSFLCTVNLNHDVDECTRRCRGCAEEEAPQSPL